MFWTSDFFRGVVPLSFADAIVKRTILFLKFMIPKSKREFILQWSMWCCVASILCSLLHFEQKEHKLSYGQCFTELSVFPQGCTCFEILWKQVCWISRLSPLSIHLEVAFHLLYWTGISEATTGENFYGKFKKKKKEKNLVKWYKHDICASARR